ncbi:hypothetical protein N657DRAFT_329594 [Parathielavia appendiculata]|uniref:Uncharacterized protein n=1 Tax=Parathielavia appendiculata TaxID=2587402 RepID=A0AAN6TQC4_9PEZI|nr:hypothetical protein N657DRAFT_329594 [Parathielavia appendiculata]
MLACLNILAYTKRHAVRRRQTQRSRSKGQKAPKPERRKRRRHTNPFHTQQHAYPTHNKPLEHNNKSRSIRIPAALPPKRGTPTPTNRKSEPDRDKPNKQHNALLRHAPELFPECLPNQTRQFPK